MQNIVKLIFVITLLIAKKAQASANQIEEAQLSILEYLNHPEYDVYHPEAILLFSHLQGYKDMLWKVLTFNNTLLHVIPHDSSWNYILDDTDDNLFFEREEEDYYPQLGVDDESDVAVYNCPLFKSDNPTILEMLRLLYMQKVLSVVKRSHLVFTFEAPIQDYEEDSYDQFEILLNSIALLVKNTTKYSKNMFIILTHCHWLIDYDVHISHFNSFLSGFHEELLSRLDSIDPDELTKVENAIELVEIFQTNQNIEIMLDPPPDRLSLNLVENIQDCRRRIFEKFFSIEYIEMDDGDLNMEGREFTTEDLEEIEGLMATAREDIESIISSEINDIGFQTTFISQQIDDLQKQHEVLSSQLIIFMRFEKEIQKAETAVQLTATLSRVGNLVDAVLPRISDTGKLEQFLNTAHSYTMTENVFNSSTFVQLYRDMIANKTYEIDWVNFMIEWSSKRTNSKSFENDFELNQNAYSEEGSIIFESPTTLNDVNQEDKLASETTILLNDEGASYNIKNLLTHNSEHKDEITELDTKELDIEHIDSVKNLKKKQLFDDDYLNPENSLPEIQFDESEKWRAPVTDKNFDDFIKYFQLKPRLLENYQYPLSRGIANISPDRREILGRLWDEELNRNEQTEFYCNSSTANYTQHSVVLTQSVISKALRECSPQTILIQAKKYIYITESITLSKGISLVLIAPFIEAENGEILTTASHGLPYTTQSKNSTMSCGGPVRHDFSCSERPYPALKYCTYEEPICVAGCSLFFTPTLTLPGAIAFCLKAVHPCNFPLKGNSYDTRECNIKLSTTSVTLSNGHHAGNVFLIAEEFRYKNFSIKSVGGNGGDDMNNLNYYEEAKDQIVSRHNTLAKWSETKESVYVNIEINTVKISDVHFTDGVGGNPGELFLFTYTGTSIETEMLRGYNGETNKTDETFAVVYGHRRSDENNLEKFMTKNVCSSLHGEECALLPKLDNEILEFDRVDIRYTCCSNVRNIPNRVRQEPPKAISKPKENIYLKIQTFLDAVYKQKLTKYNRKILENFHVYLQSGNITSYFGVEEFQDHLLKINEMDPNVYGKEQLIEFYRLFIEAVMIRLDNPKIRSRSMIRESCNSNVDGNCLGEENKTKPQSCFININENVVSSEDFNVLSILIGMAESCINFYTKDESSFRIINPTPILEVALSQFELLETINIVQNFTAELEGIIKDEFALIKETLLKALDMHLYELTQEVEGLVKTIQESIRATIEKKNEYDAEKAKYVAAKKRQVVFGYYKSAFGFLTVILSAKGVPGAGSISSTYDSVSDFAKKQLGDGEEEKTRMESIHKEFKATATTLQNAQFEFQKPEIHDLGNVMDYVTSVTAELPSKVQQDKKTIQDLIIECNAILKQKYPDIPKIKRNLNKIATIYSNIQSQRGKREADVGGIISGITSSLQGGWEIYQALKDLMTPDEIENEFADVLNAYQTLSNTITEIVAPLIQQTEIAIKDWASNGSKVGTIKLVLTNWKTKENFSKIKKVLLELAVAIGAKDRGFTSIIEMIENTFSEILGAYARVDGHNRSKRMIRISGIIKSGHIATLTHKTPAVTDKLLQAKSWLVASEAKFLYDVGTAFFKIVAFPFAYDRAKFFDDVRQTYNFRSGSSNEVRVALSDLLNQLKIEKGTGYQKFQEKKYCIGRRPAIFTWKSKTHRKEINDILTGKSVSLYSNIADSYTNTKEQFAATKFVYVYLRFEVKGNPSANKELKNVLDDYSVRLKHSGLNYFHVFTQNNYANVSGLNNEMETKNAIPVTSSIFTLHTPPTEFNISYLIDGADLPVDQSTTYSNVRMADYPFLSPFTRWEYQLVPDKSYYENFEPLEQFLNYTIDLSLCGHTYYIASENLPVYMENVTDFYQPNKEFINVLKSIA